MENVRIAIRDSTDSHNVAFLIIFLVFATRALTYSVSWLVQLAF